MIKIIDVSGTEKYINCDHIEKIEIIPDTLITLSNGHNYIVQESPEEIITRIKKFKQQCK